MTYTCFVCRKALKSSMDPDRQDGDWSDPSAYGLHWTATGNYGSGLHDCRPGAGILEIVICDDCVYERRDLVVECRESHKIERTYRPADFSRLGSYPPKGRAEVGR